MTGFAAAQRRSELRFRSNICAASARGEEIEYTGWADFVEKVVDFDVDR